MSSGEVMSVGGKMLRLNDGSGSTVTKAARVNSSHMVQ